MRVKRIATTIAVALFLRAGSAECGLLAGSFVGSSMYDVNTSTGTASNPRTIGRAWVLAYSPAGTLYAVAMNGGTPTANTLYVVNPSTGAATPIAPISPAIGVEGDIAFDPTTGILYGLDSCCRLFTINTSTGQETPMGMVPGAGDISAIAFDAAGNLYGADTMNGKLLKINKSTAAVISSTSFSPAQLDGVAGLAFDPATGTLYLATNNTLFTVNTTTAALTVIGSVGSLNIPTDVSTLTFSPILPPPEQCECLTPPHDMALWMPMDELTASAPVANPLGNAGTRSGGSIAAGVVGRSSCMNGATGYITVPSYQGLNVSNFSIDAWVRVSGTPGTHTIVDKRLVQSSTSVRGYWFYIDSSGRLSVQLGSGGVPVTTTSALTVPADGNFHHVALTVQRGLAAGGRFYLDGSFTTFSTVLPSGGGFAHGFPLRIGATTGLTPASLFDGCIDELEIFGRALDVTEVQALYATGRHGKCRLFATSPVFVNMCKVTTVTRPHHICNAGTAVEWITWSVTAKPPLGSCNFAGPTSFSPSSGGPVAIPPGQCIDVNITIGLPPFGTSTGVGCYEMVVNGSSGPILIEGSVTNECNLTK